ncbi:TRAP-type C4-dicarboxylate transport system, small permease component [Modicisalibacter ilicicola DSM 19980]|uniref:TRAP transporter small permease protein n=1 Tax=Modicisalibacter ilicicola DSM 19980 TaxID=1121942 RepID=A0A1M4THM4_9GAMM|nr:TRAP transporter small permease [Halomonas ilicicola]SHE44002.1 TRAP-type C4-dicarboxylate transport system, small permease component [Halomonas ilicicola DSM 19980]
MATTSTATAKPGKYRALRLKLDRTDRGVERWLLLTFYALIILTVAIEVVRRFALDYSSVWGEELSRYAFIYLAWLAAAAAVRDRAHIRIDVLVNLGGPRIQRLAWWLADIATLVLAVWALWLSLSPVLTSLQFGSVTPGLRVSQALFLAAIPIGFLVVAARVVQSMFADVRRMRRGEPPFAGHKLFD